MPKAASVLIRQLENDAAANLLDIPSLPDILSRIQEAVNHPALGVTEVARIIQLDAPLSARLLSVANSPLYRAPMQLTDLKQAIQRLGLGVTRNIVTSLVLNNLFTVRAPVLQSLLRDMWQQSCYVAAIAHVMAGITPGILPDRAMLAGLLHNIGALPVLVYADRHFAQAIDPSLLQEVLLQLQGRLGRQVIQHWDLGADLVSVPEAVNNWQRDEQDTVDYADVVQIAYVHSRFGRGQNDMPPLTSLPAFNKLSLSQMGPYAGIELIEQAQTEINTTVRLLSC